MVMGLTSRYAGTIRALRARWPSYVFGYGGGILAASLVIWLSLSLGWYGLAALALAFFVGLVYFLAVSLWAAHQLYDRREIGAILFELGELKPTENLANIDVGRRHHAIALARQLTTGRVIAIDVYNPQLTPNPSLTRARQAFIHPPPDPRLTWRDGNISLLPLPDESVRAVTLIETASEILQHGDRRRLFGEIERILQPGGSLLFAEHTRTAANLAVHGPAGLRLVPSAYWVKLMAESGLQLSEQVSLNGLVWCARAEKPAQAESGQTEPEPQG
jgi:SAM-dependent methyltransferase